MAPTAPRKAADKDAVVVAPDADASPESTEGADAPVRQTPKESTSGTEYLNTTGSPLVYDHDGHLVGAGEWTPPVNLDAIGKAARASEFLIPRSAL